VSLPSAAEVEHADWPALVRFAEELGLNPKGRSAIVRMRVLDHVRRRTRREPWTPGGEHIAPLLTRLGHPEAATRIWESAIRLEAPAPWVGYGSARLAAGELEEARKAYERAAQMGDAVAHLHRAELLAARGDVLGAVGACDAYLAERPEDLRALALRSGFLARGGSIDEATSALRRAADAHPDLAVAWRGLGLLLLKAGRPQDASAALRTATQTDERDADAWVLRGTALLLAGRPKEAIGAYREALEKFPDRADALNNLGVAYVASGSAKSGIVNLERASKRLESPQVLLNLARARELAERKADALRTYERVLRVAPKESEAVAGRKRLGPTKPAKTPARSPRKKRTPVPRKAPPPAPIPRTAGARKRSPRKSASRKSRAPRRRPPRRR
jgi:tetratricopeptide (TPR) repeat protein